MIQPVRISPRRARDPDEAERRALYLEFLKDGRADGAILMEPARDDPHVTGMARHYHLVQCSEYCDNQAVSHVSVDNLAAARQAGYQAALCFIVQLAGAKYVQPNDVTHPQFGQALRQAAAAGVEVFALGCSVTPDSLTAMDPVPVRL